MINNNYMLKVITVKHFACEYCFSRNVLHDEYFEEHTMTSKSPFMWNYDIGCRNVVGIKYTDKKR